MDSMASDHQNFELSVSIYIDARTDICWKILTQHMPEWWCPTPWTLTLDDVELRAGGRCNMTMHGPNGETHRSEGLFLDVVEGQRFVTTDAVARDESGDIYPLEPMMIGGWEVLPQGEGTLYRAWARHWTADARTEHENMGFTEGWQIVAQQFKALCEAEAERIKNDA
jgi:uncharacterized protein YndB with AHSA1/START domain